jgi:hypothetical protein
MKAKIYLTIFSSLIVTSLFSQKNGYFVIEPSYSYYNNHEVNFALIRSLDLADRVTDLPVGYLGPFISGGINITSNRKLLVTKTGVVGFLYFIGSRISIINYTDFNTSQFNIRPEIGLTFLGYISVTYGYNFNLNKENAFNIQGSVITCSIGFEPYLLKN